MGVRGPIPKSAETREYQGSAAHRPMPPSRPAHAFGIPECPKGMPAGARRIWGFYAEQLALLGTLRPVDALGLQMICLLQSDIDDLEKGKRRLVGQRKKQAKEEKRAIEGSALVEFEMTKEARRLEATVNGKRSQLKQLCDRYGLNPIAGTRLEASSSGFIPNAGVPLHSPEVNEIESLIQ